MEKNAYWLKLTAHGVRCVEWVKQAVGKDQSRLSLTHFYLDRSAEGLRLVGCDGRRMHVVVWDAASMGDFDLPGGMYRIVVGPSFYEEVLAVPFFSTVPYPNYRNGNSGSCWAACPVYDEFPGATRDKALYFAARKSVALDADYLAEAMGLSGQRMERVRVDPHASIARVEYVGGSYALIMGLRCAVQVELVGEGDDGGREA